MEKQGFQDAERAQKSLLAALEKKTLIWLAQRMPSGVNSDHLTVLGAIGMLAAGLCYWWAKTWPPALLLVILCLVINWFGDSLDGTLARVRNKLRPRYGFYVDHVVDTYGAFFLLGGIALSGYMTPILALGLLIAYYMLAIEIFLATYALGTFKLSFGKWGPTELRILLCIGNLFLYFRGPNAILAGRTYLLFDIGAVAGMAGLILMMILSSIRNTRTLYRKEPLS